MHIHRKDEQRTERHETFDELVKYGIEIELDAIVTGESLTRRVRRIMDVAALWRSKQTAARRGG